MRTPSPDIVVLGYPQRLQADHAAIVDAAHRAGLTCEVWGPDTLAVDVTHPERPGEPPVRVLRHGMPTTPQLVLPRAVNRVWPYCTLVARAWEQSGTVVVNDVTASGVCGDKLATLMTLAQAGVPMMPAAGVSPGTDATLDNVTRRHPDAALVVKPAYGSGGVDVRRVSRDEAAVAVRTISPAPAWLLDHYLVGSVADGAGVDWRVVVAEGRTIAVTERTAAPGAFTTNGKDTAVVAVDPGTVADICAVAEAAAAAIGLVFAGVDVIMHRGRPVVLEVNSWPGLAHTAEVSGVDLAGHLVAAAVRTLHRR